MKPVYKCDYCSFMGTEEEVREHEPLCNENYNMKSCYTCKNRGKMTMENKMVKYECEAGKDIPAGNIIVHCELYNRKEKSTYPLTDVFGGLFNKTFF